MLVQAERFPQENHRKTSLTVSRSWQTSEIAKLFVRTLSLHNSTRVGATSKACSSPTSWSLGGQTWHRLSQLKGHANRSKTRSTGLNCNSGQTTKASSQSQRQKLGSKSRWSTGRIRSGPSVNFSNSNDAKIEASSKSCSLFIRGRLQKSQKEKKKSRLRKKVFQSGWTSLSVYWRPPRVSNRLTPKLIVRMAKMLKTCQVKISRPQRIQKSPNLDPSSLKL